ncbi:M20 family metallopeptidase [Thermodesulfobacteriota bacterium]
MNAHDNNLQALIRRNVSGLLDEAVALRRRLHRIPEEAFQEHKTAALLQEELCRAGIACETGFSGTGIVATVTGSRPGNTVALRADMDGLVLEEKTAAAYASTCPGLAHSCGHDGHMACLLAAARILSGLKDRLAGTVRCIFQPAEEAGNGASTMLDCGALGAPLPNAIFALHAWPYIETGVVASMPGPITFGNELFIITVKGRGGHGARPHESASPILAAAKIAQRVSELTRCDGSGRPLCVVSVGMLQGGSQPNVIPDEAVIQGTMRTRSEHLRDELLQQLQEAMAQACSQDGLGAVLDRYHYCPPVENHAGLFRLFEQTADELLGAHLCEPLYEASTGSEDFGFFTRQVPGLLIRLGMGTGCPPLHTSRFDFNDAALAAGITIMTGLALKATEPGFCLEQGIAT